MSNKVEIIDYIASRDIVNSYTYERGTNYTYFKELVYPVLAKYTSLRISFDDLMLNAMTSMYYALQTQLRLSIEGVVKGMPSNEYSASTASNISLPYVNNNYYMYTENTNDCFVFDPIEYVETMQIDNSSNDLCKLLIDDDSNIKDPLKFLRIEVLKNTFKDFISKYIRNIMHMEMTDAFNIKIVSSYHPSYRGLTKYPLYSSCNYDTSLDNRKCKCIVELCRKYFPCINGSTTIHSILNYMLDSVSWIEVKVEDTTYKFVDCYSIIHKDNYDEYSELKLKLVKLMKAKPELDPNEALIELAFYDDTISVRSEYEYLPIYEYANGIEKM